MIIDVNGKVCKIPTSEYNKLKTDADGNFTIMDMSLLHQKKENCVK